MRREAMDAYWRANLRYIVLLLSISVAVSYGAGVLLADDLDGVSVAGFPLGFWAASQGSIAAFVAIVFAYVRLMNGLDRRFDVYEE
jgi:putative solute:sodium symporter small subunit